MDEKDYKILVIHGGEYKTFYSKKYENRKKWAKPNDKQILSYIPGTIKQVFAKEGKSVKKGEALFILEAMKMENTIFAPFDGKIKLISIKDGTKVPKGQLLIEFE